MSRVWTKSQETRYSQLTSWINSISGEDARMKEKEPDFPELRL